ncbi:hypothetical protein ACHAXN_005412 [Cyclotella atomus]
MVMNIRPKTRSNLIPKSPRLHLILTLAAVAAASIAIYTKSSSTSKLDSTTPKSAQSMSTPTTISYQQVPSNRPDVLRFTAISSSTLNPISISSWMNLVSSQSEKGIRASMDLSSIISTCDYESILFETMGTSYEEANSTPFEFALVSQPALKRFAESSPDRLAFDEHFEKCLKEHKTKSADAKVPTVCYFDNLGGDARLVSPLPQPNIPQVSYSHIAAFVRNAPRHQIEEFWAVAAKQYLDVLKQHSGGRKRWFSTNGMGVAWLHLRLDSRPKYYSYSPFK